MDADGAIWTSLGMAKDTTVRVTEGGEILERIPHARSPFACMLGGDDGRTLLSS
jgi:sugar lactone lactonase YvrE